MASSNGDREKALKYNKPTEIEEIFTFSIFKFTTEMEGEKSKNLAKMVQRSLRDRM